MKKPKPRKFLVDKEACCSDCEMEYSQFSGSNVTVDAWAKKHAIETGHDVTITETHQVSVFDEETQPAP